MSSKSTSEFSMYKGNYQALEGTEKNRLLFTFKLKKEQHLDPSVCLFLIHNVKCRVRQSKCRQNVEEIKRAIEQTILTLLLIYTSLPLIHTFTFANLHTSISNEKAITHFALMIAFAFFAL